MENNDINNLNYLAVSFATIILSHANGGIDIGLLLSAEKLFKQGKTAEAIAIQTRLIRKYPGSFLVRYYRGSYRIASHKFKSGIKDLNEVLRLIKGYKPALLNRGYAYYRLGEYQKAIKDFKKVIEIDPNNIDALSYHGLVLLLQEKPDKAWSCFNKILQLQKGNDVARFYRGYCYYLLYKDNAALKDFEKIKNNNSALREKALGVIEEISLYKQLLPPLAGWLKVAFVRRQIPKSQVEETFIHIRK